MSSMSSKDISATPAVDQHISHNGREYTTIKEGLAHILTPITAAKTPQTIPKGGNQAQSVFYNPIQQFNRDLSVLAIKAYGEEVMERKLKEASKSKEKFKAKQKEKKMKRKREDGAGDESRKSAKIETDIPGETPEANADPTSENLRMKLDDENKAMPAEENAVVGIEIGQNEAINAPGHQLEQNLELPDTTTASQSYKLPETNPFNGLNGAAKPEPAQKPRQPTFTILDALSATGLRALRYANEIPFTTSVTANDLLAAATKVIEMNIKHNKLEDKIESVTGNALTHMYSLAGENRENERGQKIHSRKYDVIDLDPYGTAAPFLDAAVQSVRDDGGLICVTCTDAGVWASNGYPEKAYSLYGGIPIKGMHSHEGGLRLILNSIATSAARYGLAMEPLLSLSIDFYARVFVRIHKSAADVKFLAGKTMMVYNCDQGCGAWTNQMVGKNKLAPNKNGTGHFWKHVFSGAPTASEKCAHCGTSMHLAGPMYAGPIHSPEFIQRILDHLPNVSKDTYQTTDRIEGMLNLALEETLPPREEDVGSPTLISKTDRYDPAALDLYPFFFIPSVLAKVIHCVTPHENALRGAIRHLGYRVTRSHTKPGSIKTDAPWEVIWEIMREWARQKAPIRDGAIKKGTAGWNIMRMDRKIKENGIKKDEAYVDKEDIQGNVENVSEMEPKLEIVFDEQLGKERDRGKFVRYQVNPRENWGPMNRAKGHA